MQNYESVKYDEKIGYYVFYLWDGLGLNSDLKLSLILLCSFADRNRKSKRECKKGKHVVICKA